MKQSHPHGTALYLDLEGDEGEVPRTLEDSSLQLITQWQQAAGMALENIQVYAKTVIKKRRDMVQRDVPPLAYLLSDVIVFVDTIELRRTSFANRVRNFAELVHQQVSAAGYQPALIVVQNKWSPEQKGQALDQTDVPGYKEMIDGLGVVFSSVRLLRIPTGMDPEFLEEGFDTLHSAIGEAVESVRGLRNDAGALFSEKDWWMLAKKVVGLMDEHGGHEGLQSLSAVQSEFSFDKNDVGKQARFALNLWQQKEPAFDKALSESLRWLAHVMSG